MESKLNLWSRIPLIVRAMATGLFITALGGGIWTTLVAMNLQTAPGVPWAVPVTAILLWPLWRYLGGRGWPASTSEKRRSLLRANRISGRVWGWALLAGGLAMSCLVGVWILAGRLVEMPPRQLPDMSAYPQYMILAFVVMASLVAAVSEEAGFRGYTQVPLEGRYGPVIAILVSSIAFSIAHLTHGAFLPALVLYFLGGVTWGATAYLSSSILPGIVLHASVDIVFFLFVWPHDVARPLVWESGADLGFWLTVAQVLVCAALAVAAYRKLGSIARSKADEGPAPLAGVH